MQKALFIKLMVILGLILFLMIPINMVDRIVSERMAYRDVARSEIQQSWTGSQRVIGPMLVLPYEKTYQRKVWEDDKKNYRLVTHQTQHKLILLPETLQIDGHLATEERQLGLYKVPVYTSELNLQGSFNNHKAVQLQLSTKENLSWGKPYTVLMINDLRGITVQPILQWDGEDLPFESGTDLTSSIQGMHVKLPDLIHDKESILDFAFDLTLRGMESLAFSPIAKNTQIQLNSAWPHPSFTGRYLPTQHSINDQGFQANWTLSSFSSGMSDRADECAAGNCNKMLNQSFGVSLVNPIDIYQQSDRSLKYAILFLTLTFAFFFLYEVLKKLSIHPVQYALVGLAIAVFYLLLVSLSEQISFGWAYLIAALACSGLLGSYIGSILKNRNSGITFFIALIALYGVLFSILQSEDNALLMGSLLLFSTLASAMMATRNVDWNSMSTGMTKIVKEIDN